MSAQIIKGNSSIHFQASASLHAQGITEGFLSSLGPSFLTELYKGIAETENSGIFIAIEDNQILGFISYAQDLKSCYKKVLKTNFIPLTRTILPNFFKPAFIYKIIETLLYPLVHKNSNNLSSDPKAPGFHPELLSMAVAENARGKSIGKLLVKAVDQEMGKMGLPGYFVVTHGTDERSNGFYKRCGFVRTSQYKHHGKPMNKYYKTL